MEFINKLYKYFLASFFFWVYILKGVLVYSLIPAGYALFSVIEEIRKERDDGTIGGLFKSYYQEYKHLKLQSFLSSFLLIVIYSLLFLANQYSGGLAALISFVMIYFLAVTIILLTFSMNFLRYHSLTFKDTLIYSFIYSIRNLWVTIIILVALGLIAKISNKNFIILLFISPSLYGLFVRFLFERFISTKLPPSIKA